MSENETYFETRTKLLKLVDAYKVSEKDPKNTAARNIAEATLIELATRFLSDISTIAKAMDKLAQDPSPKRVFPLRNE